MTPPLPPAEPSPPHPPPLIFDWRHRQRTWLKLSFFLLLATAAHLAAFVLFRVRTTPPARTLPLPATLTLAPAWPGSPAATDGPGLLAVTPSPAENLDLELPEHAPPEPHTPSFASHEMTRQPWPTRPERAAWPELSGVSRPVLPPASPAPPSETPAVPPR